MISNLLYGKKKLDIKLMEHTKINVTFKTNSFLHPQAYNWYRDVKKKNKLVS